MAKHEELPPNQGGSLTETGGQRQRRLDRRTFIRTGLAVGGGLVAAAYVKPNLQSIGIPRAFASVTPDGGTLCMPMCIDFEKDADGNDLIAGNIITTQFAGIGVMTVSTKTYGNTGGTMENFNQTAIGPLAGNPAMIFDSANPTGGDFDLGTPNKKFSGPGGPNEDDTNKKPLHNILIIAERLIPGWEPGDKAADGPDDNAGGGRLVFRFSSPVRVDQVDVLDIDDGNDFGSRVQLYSDLTDASDSSLLFNFKMPDLGNNSFQTVTGDGLGSSLSDFDNVLRLEVVFKHSGAVAKVCWCGD